MRKKLLNPLRLYSMGGAKGSSVTTPTKEQQKIVRTQKNLRTKAGLLIVQQPEPIYKKDQEVLVTLDGVKNRVKGTVLSKVVWDAENKYYNHDICYTDTHGHMVTQQVSEKCLDYPKAKRA